MTDKSPQFITELTAQLVAAYVENNPVQLSALPELVASVSASLFGLGKEAAAAKPAPVPPVNPKRTVHHDYLISLEDGKKYKTLRRHLSTHGLTPDEYRKKWNLPADYPMVAPSYAEARSRLAKEMGLGRKPGSGARKKRARQARQSRGH